MTTHHTLFVMKLCGTYSDPRPWSVHTIPTSETSIPAPMRATLMTGGYASIRTVWTCPDPPYRPTRSPRTYESLLPQAR